MTAILAQLISTVLVLGTVYLVVRRSNRRPAPRPVDHVRLHLKPFADPSGNTREGETIEGFRVFTTPDHYVLERAKWLVGTEQTLSLEGNVEVPRRDVFFVQVLAVDVSGGGPQQTA